MVTLTESLGASDQHGLLAQGLEVISKDQTLTFTKYVRLVLPLDGFVFWALSTLTNDTSEGAATLIVKGSVHYTTVTNQNEDETISINSILFNASSEVQDLNAVSSNTIYIASFQGLRFAFSTRRAFFLQASIYHYSGNAIYPAMESQIIDDVADIDSADLVVSNSLPVWLSLNQFMPVYPARLVDSNIPPPYAVVNVKDETTMALQGMPVIEPNGSSYQLVSEEVKITMYGIRNDTAIDYLNYVLAYSYSDVIGIMNMPTVRDEKRTQNELNILAMKKSITFKVSYYQARINNVARQLILSCIPTYNPTDYQ